MTKDQNPKQVRLYDDYHKKLLIVISFECILALSYPRS